MTVQIETKEEGCAGQKAPAMAPSGDYGSVENQLLANLLSIPEPLAYFPLLSTLLRCSFCHTSQSKQYDYMSIFHKKPWP